MVFNRNKLNEHKRQGEYLILQKKKPLILSGFQIHSWSWRESLEPFHKISNSIKYQIIKYLYLFAFNLNIS